MQNVHAFAIELTRRFETHKRISLVLVLYVFVFKQDSVLLLFDKRRRVTFAGRFQRLREPHLQKAPSMALKRLVSTGRQSRFQTTGSK